MDVSLINLVFMQFQTTSDAFEMFKKQLEELHKDGKLATMLKAMSMTCKDFLGQALENELISVRTHNALITPFGDKLVLALVQVTENELFEKKNIVRKAIYEIKKALAEYYLGIGINVPPAIKAVVEKMAQEK